MSELMSEILKLGVRERVLLAHQIWESVQEAPEEQTLSQEQETELLLSLDEHDQNPETSVSWQELRSRLMRKA